ncbi:phage tail tape measure protein [Brucella anthropi]|uniref:phage tail tape measure protein n=1 Tax=Brucella anthropi TaxID=529 RepID=UPI000F66C975|nr:phage tail tape measure protein [Brucella anthropi]RRY08792.1 phage tail tape measure protein [Brucella anthropi]
MANLTSSLLVRLIDGVSKPATKAATALRSIGKAATDINGMQSRLNSAIDRNNKALDNARGRMVDAVAAFYTLKSALSAPLDAAMNLETQLEDIGQKANIPQERLGALGKQLRQVARETNQATSKMAQGMDTLVGFGANENDALGLLKPIGRAATAYRAEVDDLAKAGFAALDNLKVPATDFGKALDAMAQAGKEGAFELRDMAQYFPSLGAAYQGLKQKGVPAVADLSAALQIVRKGAGDSEEAATNLANVLQKINAPQTRKAFDKMGVDLEKSMKKAMDKGMTPIEAIAEITNRTLKGDLGKLGDLFQDAQVQKGLRPLIQNILEYRRIRAEAMKAQGVVEEDYQRRLKTSRGFADRLRATIENLNASLGVALLPAFNDIADAVSLAATKLAEFAEANPKLTRSIVLVTSALIGLRIALTALNFVGLMAKGGALSVLSLGLRGIAPAAFVASKVLMGPLRKSLSVASGYFGTLALRSRLATAATGKAPGVFARLADAGIVAGRGLLRMLNPLNLLRGGFSILRGAAVVLRGALMFTGVGAVLAGIAAAGTLIYNNWEGLKSFFVGVGEGFVKALEPVKPIIEPIAKFSTDIFNSISNLLGPLGATNAEWKSWGETVGGVVGGAVSTIIEKISTLVGWLRSGVEAAGKLMSALSGPVGPSGLPYTVTGGSDGSGGVNTPSYMGGAIVPDGKRAKGGPISAGSTYLTGEDGPEIITPSRNGYVHPNGKAPGGFAGSTRASAAGSRFQFGDIHIHGVSNPESVGRKLNDAIEAQLRGIHSDWD